MLLEKSLVGQVVAIKLMNAEEIIGRLVAHEGDTYTIKHPVVLTLVPTGPGQSAVTFTPFSMGIDEDQAFEINLARMLFKPVPAREDAEKQYVKVTSGIELVTNPSSLIV